MEPPVNAARLNLVCGWIGILGGILSGAIMGLSFHRDEWLGGYGSHPRRLVRLGHISFFGLGILNLLFGLSVRPLQLSARYVTVSSLAFLVSLATMPACCFLTAWRRELRALFPIPVAAASIGVVGILLGFLNS